MHADVCFTRANNHTTAAAAMAAATAAIAKPLTSRERAPVLTLAIRSGWEPKAQTVWDLRKARQRCFSNMPSATAAPRWRSSNEGFLAAHLQRPGRACAPERLVDAPSLLDTSSRLLEPDEAAATCCCW